MDRTKDTLIELLHRHQDTPSGMLRAYYTGMLLNRNRMLKKSQVTRDDVHKFNAMMDHLKDAIVIIEEIETHFK
jgi:hypothetical protein